MTSNMVAGLWSAVLGVAPIRRFEAMRSNVNEGFVTQGWFIALGVTVISSLLVLLFVVYIYKIFREKRLTEDMFNGLSVKAGLGSDDVAILRDIAFLSGIKKIDSIFNIGSAFEQGSNKLLEEQTKAGLSEHHMRQLRLRLAFLRERLGFYKRFEASNMSSRTTDLKSLNTRQIPVDKKIHITRRKESGKDIEATVVENDESGLKVTLEKPLAIVFGQTWCARYYLGQALWEFDTEVVSYDGNILILKHSENIRYINRRRFLRIPVKEPAGVASFPFTKGDSEGGAANALITLYPPEFLPATITELGGPGLKIMTKLDVRPGERVLVMFRTEEPKEGQSEGIMKIIQEVGEIKHRREVEDGFEIALELNRVNDREFDELLKLTNSAAMKAVDDSKKAEESKVEAEKA
jgi:hypothetical protein